MITKDQRQKYLDDIHACYGVSIGSIVQRMGIDYKVVGIIARDTGNHPPGDPRHEVNRPWITGERMIHGERIRRDLCGGWKLKAAPKNPCPGNHP